MTQMRERNTLRQQFFQDDVTGTIRSALRNYCIDVDSSEFSPNNVMCVQVLLTDSYSEYISLEIST